MKKIILFISVLIITDIIAQSENVGIGTNSPLARLEVKGNGNTLSTNNLVLRNSSGDTLLRMCNDSRMGIGYNGNIYRRTLNVGGNGINLYITDTNFAGALFPTDTSVIFWSGCHENNYVILQPNWGKVGVGNRLRR